MKFTRNDTILLQEAYDLRLLKEQAPSMTISQVINNLDIMSESEVVYMNKVADRILNEFAGGIGALGKAVGSGLKKLGGATVQGVKDRVGSAAQGAKSLGNAALQGAKAAGQQAVSNVSDIYQTGQQVSDSGGALKKAHESMRQLIDLLNAARDGGLIKFGGDITRMTLEDIIEKLTIAQQSAQTFQKNAQTKGIGGGVLDAAKQGFRSARPTA